MLIYYHMRNKFDIGDFVNVPTEQSIINSLVARFKARRKESKISQSELATRSGVSYASIRRFENTGKISLTSLIKIAHAIGYLEDFDNLFITEKIDNLKDYKK